MKRVLFIALAASLSLASMANGGKKKAKKQKKEVKTEQVCPANCPRTHCPFM